MTSAAEDPAPEKRTILAVEDQPEVLDLAVTFLAEEGYSVIGAASGDEAVELMARHERIDLVFTDIVMPGAANGFAVARRAIAANPATRILYTTGYADELRRNEPLLVRGDLLPKPYRLALLGARVAELLTTPPEELNRILRDAYRHWRASCVGDQIPGEDILLNRPFATLLPFTSIIDAVADGAGFRYRTVGAAVIGDIGRDLSGELVGGAVPAEHQRFLLGIYREVAETLRPIYVASVYATADATVATERLFLPLTAQAGRATTVAVTQTFDRIDTRASIYEVMQERPGRRDFVRRIEPG
jgi:CheY-like chemotaxis protein